MSANSNVIFPDLEKMRFQYGSDLSIYTERLVDGRLLCAGFQDNGVTIYEHSELVDKPSFDLVIDGESLYYGWEFAGFESSISESGSTDGILNLKHTSTEDESGNAMG